MGKQIANTRINRVKNKAHRSKTHGPNQQGSSTCPSGRHFMGNICRTASYQKSNPCTERMIKKRTILYFSEAQCRNSRTSNPKLSMEAYLKYLKTQNICHEETAKYSKYYLMCSLLSPLFTDYSSLKWKQWVLLFFLIEVCRIITFPYSFFLPRIHFPEKGINPPVNMTIKAMRSSVDVQVSDSRANIQTGHYQALIMPF